MLKIALALLGPMLMTGCSPQVATGVPSRTGTGPTYEQSREAFDAVARRYGSQSPSPQAEPLPYAQWREQQITQLSEMSLMYPGLPSGLRGVAERAVSERRQQPTPGVAYDRAIREEMAIARRDVDRRFANSPVAPSGAQNVRSWREGQITALAGASDSDPDADGGIQSLATRSVLLGQPQLQGAAFQRSVREEELGIRAEIDRRRPGIRADQAATAEAARRGASDNMAIAACNARAQAADAMYPDRSILRLGAMMSSIQVRNACLDYYRATGQVPGF